MRIMRVYRIEVAHWLPNLPDTHKCSRLHRHEYKITLTLAGELDKHFGWVMEFDDIDKNVQPVLDRLDHHCLNDVIPNPTVENLAIWIWDNIDIKSLIEVEVWETESSGCVYVGV